ncbi:MAG: pyruvate kinase [Planctomycetaceae bacterium]
MDLRQRRYTEGPLVKTKIIATVGPACESFEMLRDLAQGGVDLFRLNFAHGTHAWMRDVLAAIRRVSEEAARPIAVLADLAGPKLRLGKIADDEILCREGDRIAFVRGEASDDPGELTSLYESLIDDLSPGDLVLLADGTVGLRIVEKSRAGNRAEAVVEMPGRVRSRQGINLPGVALSMPSLTPKDRDDLAWAVANEVDYIGLSFVQSAEDVRELRNAIAEFRSERPPQIVAKIEKMEAVSDLERILAETDAVMVARGDLGVEVDIARVPALQKRIIAVCNQHRIPVITATQMLDSMTVNERPTRAEASDVANAVLDGSDAVMLSGETAIGQHPALAVEMMSRIAREAERLVDAAPSADTHSTARTRATPTTEAVTLAAGVAAAHLEADLLVVATHSGRTAMAVSKQRGKVPVLAITDRAEIARRMCLYWGITPLESLVADAEPTRLLKFVVEWGKKQQALSVGSRIVLVGTTDWSKEGKDVMLVHAVP